MKYTQSKFTLPACTKRMTDAEYNRAVGATVDYTVYEPLLIEVEASRNSPTLQRSK